MKDKKPKTIDEFIENSAEAAQEIMFKLKM